MEKRDIKTLIQKLKAKGIFPIDFSNPCSADMTPGQVRNSCKRAIDRTKNTFPEPFGKFELRSELAHYYKQKRILLDPNEEIVITNDVNDIFFLLNIVFSKNITIQNPRPTYFENGLSLTKAKVTLLNQKIQNKFKIDPKKLPTKTDYLFITNPTFPSGQTYSGTEIKSILEHCTKHNIKLIVDESFISLYYDEKPQSFLKYSTDILVIGSFGFMSNMSNYNIGYICGNKELITEFKNHTKNISGVSHFIQDSAQDGLEDKNHRDQIRNDLKCKLNHLTKALDAANLSFIRPQASPNVTVFSKEPGIELTKNLLTEEYAIKTTPGIDVCSQKNEKLGKDFIIFSLSPKIKDIKEIAQKLSRFN